MGTERPSINQALKTMRCDEVYFTSSRKHALKIPGLSRTYDHEVITMTKNPRVYKTTIAHCECSENSFYLPSSDSAVPHTISSLCL